MFLLFTDWLDQSHYIKFIFILIKAEGQEILKYSLTNFIVEP